MRIIDVSSPADPSEFGSYDTPGTAWCVAVSANYAYVADGLSGLRIIDVTDQANPAEVGFFDTPDFAGGVVVVGAIAYVADGNAGIVVINVVDPVHPTELGFFDTAGAAYGVAAVGNTAYVADGNSGIRIIDITDPTTPAEVGFYSTPDKARDVAVTGRGDMPTWLIGAPGWSSCASQVDSIRSVCRGFSDDTVAVRKKAGRSCHKSTILDVDPPAFVAGLADISGLLPRKAHFKSPVARCLAAGRFPRCRVQAIDSKPLG